MNRGEALITIVGVGALGGGVLAGGALYGSSPLDIERMNDGIVVRMESERMDSLPNTVTPVEGDDAIIGISIPDQTTVE